jgi:hypothetical protein
MAGVFLLALVLLWTTVVPATAQVTRIEISYFYSFIHKKPLTTTLQPRKTFTIYNQVGGCGTGHRDIAQVEVDAAGQIRAYNHDCLSGDGPGTYGPWVSSGCSTAEEFGYIVEACILPDVPKKR